MIDPQEPPPSPTFPEPYCMQESGPGLLIATILAGALLLVLLRCSGCLWMLLIP